jgi:hypothetical protein
MACYLYKKDENGDIVKEECIAQDVANMLNHGYKSSPDDFLEGDLNDDGEVTNEEVRQAAKDAGVDKWETARISTLRRELGYDD